MFLNIKGTTKARGKYADLITSDCTEFKSLIKTSEAQRVETPDHEMKQVDQVFFTSLSSLNEVGVLLFWDFHFA